MATEDDLYDDLDAFLAGDAAEGPDPERPGDLPPARDAHTANRYLRARNSLAEKAKQYREVADAEIAKTRAWRDDRTAGIDRQVTHLDRLLEGWMRAVNADDPDRKTEKLPNGELWLRGGQFRVEVTDEDALREWLWANDPTLLNIVATPRLGELKGRTVTDPKSKAQADRPLRIGPGPVASSEDEDWWEVVTGDGEPIPGVRLAKPSSDRFSVKP